MLDINERLDNLEARLLDIEIRLGMVAPADPSPARAAASWTSAPIAAADTARPAADPARTATTGPNQPATAGAAPRAPARGPAEAVSATQLMAWGAGFALLLAAVYFLGSS
jgi:hypothetical protein